ncbi:MAG: hypothetical protein CME70_03330 [Halobacteriovorax sp.]|nr:hypothetical protein [Halobacteriovorax sp.]MBK23016.1 hypothetical protein [Halobacteriovorax sp.]
MKILISLLLLFSLEAVAREGRDCSFKRERQYTKKSELAQDLFLSVTNEYLPAFTNIIYRNSYTNRDNSIRKLCMLEDELYEAYEIMKSKYSYYANHLVMVKRKHVISRFNSPDILYFWSTNQKPYYDYEDSFSEFIIACSDETSEKPEKVLKSFATLKKNVENLKDVILDNDSPYNEQFFTNKRLLDEFTDGCDEYLKKLKLRPENCKSIGMLEIEDEAKSKGK